MPTDAVTIIVGLIGSGTIGAVLVEVIRGRRESKRDKVEVPAQAEQTISAGAKDAVEAIRSTLAELRDDLASQRQKCDDLEVRLDETKQELEVAKGEIEQHRRRNAVLEGEVARLKERLAAYDQGQSKGD